MTTLFLSTWTVVHVVVPPEASQFYSERSAACVAFFFAPELGAVKSIAGLLRSRALQKSLRLVEGWESCSLKQAFLVIMKGLYLGEGSGSVKADKLIELARSGRLHFVDFPTDAQINARSKTDWLAKAIALSQTVWFAANILSRLAGKYQITPFEVLTTAYVCCGQFMAICWFRCPQDLQEKFTVKLREEDGDGPNEDDPSKLCVKGMSYSMAHVAFVICQTIFLSIHLAAWNYPFPTIAETWLWRAVSFATWILGTGYGCLVSLYRGSPVPPFLSGTIISLYTACRLAVLALALAALRQSPAGVYDRPSWGAYWGHIGA
ncbi:hypothetical protein DL767_011218 [Monosporascus sp. MG133]|nr:hypothetical protein DL767_011218 [Monosporascus sp. MG133]